MSIKNISKNVCTFVLMFFILQLGLVAFAAGYEVEPNGISILANQVTTNSVMIGEISSPEDVDWFEFYLTNSGVVDLNFQHYIVGPGRPRYKVAFYKGIGGSSGNFIRELLITDDSAVANTGPFFLEAGTYFLEISGEQNVLYSTVGEYRFKITTHGKNKWIYKNSSWFYVGNDGKLATGWRKISSKWYYFNSQGIMQTGWKKVSGKWYYLDSSGAMQIGWQRVSGKWYYLDSSGAMQIGWQRVSGKWYYLDSSGAMQTGWLKLSGKWYYLDSSGAMQTGWLKLSGKWYYLASSGAMQTGWQKISGKWYYFYSSGEMAFNTSIGGYVLGPDGAML